MDCIVFGGDKNQPLSGGKREDRFYSGIGSDGIGRITIRKRKNLCTSTSRAVSQ